MEQDPGEFLLSPSDCSILVGYQPVVSSPYSDLDRPATDVRTASWGRANVAPALPLLLMIQRLSSIGYFSHIGYDGGPMMIDFAC
jgi:hypothetical protein